MNEESDSFGRIGKLCSIRIQDRDDEFLSFKYHLTTTKIQNKLVT
jgi:hypothetical protein